MTVATAILTTGASAVPICPLTNDHFDGIRNFRNYAHWGVEGLIAPAFGSEVFNAYRSQILVWVGVLDARQNLAGGFAGCYGSDCQIQIGNIKGTISDTFGGFYGTFAVNPYIEEYDKNGYFVRVFNDIPLASSASRYTVYDTGIVDTAGFHML